MIFPIYEIWCLEFVLFSSHRSICFSSVFLCVCVIFLADPAELLLDKSQKMIERFNYPWEMMPLLYVILKYANGDLEEATNQLNEGNQLLYSYESYKL